MRIVLLALVTALAWPAAAGATYRDFRSPTGKVGCAFYSDAETPPFVRCDWRGSDDRGVELGQTGRARLRHVTDTVLDPRAPVLRYGHTWHFHRLRCRSRRTGITCRSTRSGHGFRVSAEKRTLF